MGRVSIAALPAFTRALWPRKVPLVSVRLLQLPRRSVFLGDEPAAGGF
jgi:hypothetical protein